MDVGATNRGFLAPGGNSRSPDPSGVVQYRRVIADTLRNIHLFWKVVEKLGFEEVPRSNQCDPNLLFSHRYCVFGFSIGQIEKRGDARILKQAVWFIKWKKLGVGRPMGKVFHFLQASEVGYDE